MLLGGFGLMFTLLPTRLIQPSLGLTLGLLHLTAFILIFRRAKDPGPEQRGWGILAGSLLFNLGANAVLALARTDWSQVSPMDVAWLTFQILIAFVQIWAMLSWPFTSSQPGNRKQMNLLGGLLFGSSLFLLLWSTTVTTAFQGDTSSIFMRMLALSLRVAFAGGVNVFLLIEDPRRLKGPLGWVLLGNVFAISIVILGRPYLYTHLGIPLATPLFAVTLVQPLAFMGAVLCGKPVEAHDSAPNLRRLLLEALIYLPFVASGGVLLISVFRHSPYLMATTIGFLGVSGLLLARQFLLLREVRRANEWLEERVLARTKSLEEMQGTLLRTERMNSIATLGAGLAHDLNNSLMVVKNHAELARIQAAIVQPTSLPNLDRILVAADKSAALTRRLMDFARRHEVPVSRLDLGHAIQEHGEILRMLLPRNIALTLDLEAGQHPILGSLDRLEQVLVNLVANARDALPEGGKITVTLRRDAASKAVLLRVEDTGIGMDHEVLSRLFQPFFTTKPADRGTGLGLASVRVILEEMNGAIQVQSEPGRGTAFDLRFPLAI
jgi:signal transduction histidine kinase